MSDDQHIHEEGCVSIPVGKMLVIVGDHYARQVRVDSEEPLQGGRRELGEGGITECDVVFRSSVVEGHQERGGGGLWERKRERERDNMTMHLL